MGLGPPSISMVARHGAGTATRIRSSQLWGGSQATLNNRPVTALSPEVSAPLCFNTAQLVQPNSDPAVVARRLPNGHRLTNASPELGSSGFMVTW